MSANLPNVYQWTGDSFVPTNSYFAKKCDEQFTIGQRYGLEEVHERSGNSHRHYFAAVREGFNNLPEAYLTQFPTAEHLRKYALIKGGFCDMQVIVLNDIDEARTVLRFMQSANTFDIYTNTQGDGFNTLTRYTAKSQSYRTMDRGEFQRSKTAVLDIIAVMIGTTRDALEANAERAA